MALEQPSLPRTVALLQDRGDIVGLVMDVDDTIGARVRKQDEHRILQLMSKDTGHWKSVYKWSQADRVWPLRTDRVKGTVLMVSNVGRHKNALIELSLSDGKERVLSSGTDNDAQQEGVNRHPSGLKLTQELTQPAQ